MRINTNLVTISCITIAGIIEAYQQALSGSPLAATRLPQLDGGWHYVPLGLLIVGGGFWVGGLISKRGQKDSSIVANPPEITNFPRPTFLQPEGRILTEMTPAQLCQIYRDHTTFDANKLVEPHIGTWLFISGAVYNVDVKASGISRVSIDGIEGVSLIACWFEQKWQKQAAIRKRGNSVNVNGKISAIDASTISLEECEFV